jgi:hypothetical protein
MCVVIPSVLEFQRSPHRPLLRRGGNPAALVFVCGLTPGCSPARWAFRLQRVARRMTVTPAQAGVQWHRWLSDALSPGCSPARRAFRLQRVARRMTVAPAQAGAQWLRFVAMRCVIARLLACAAGVSSACQRPSHFSLLAQRKVTQRNGNPDSVLAGLRPPRRELGPGFSTGLLPWRKGIGIPANPPAGLFVPDSLTAYGSRERAMRALFKRAKPRAKAKSEERNALQRTATSRATPCLPAHSAGIKGPLRALLLISGPLGPGGGMEDQPAGEPAGRRLVFRQHRRCCRKTPQSLRALCGHRPQSGYSGLPFSLVTFSWARKRKSLGRRQADETPAAQASNLATTHSQKPRTLNSSLRWDNGYGWWCKQRSNQAPIKTEAS